MRGQRATRQKSLKDNGRAHDYDTALEEVVADAMETILKDGNVVEFMAEVKQKDYSSWQKLKGWFKNLAKFLRKMIGAYHGVSAQTEEGERVAAFARDLLQQIERIWAEGAMAAGENYQAAEVQKNTTDEGGVKYSFVGRTADGLGIYKTNYSPNTPKSVKQADLINLVQDVWSNKPILLTIVEEGRYVDITAKFNPELKERSDLSKIAFGNRKGTAAEQRMTLDLASDLYQIASEARFNYSKNATPKPNNPAHDGVTKYHYFLTNLVYKDNDGNYIQCHMNIDVKRNAEGDWFYSFAIEKGSAPQTLLAAVTEGSATLPNDTIPNAGTVVKNESLDNVDVEIDNSTEAVAPTVLNSERTWTESDYVQEREKAVKAVDTLANQTLAAQPATKMSDRDSEKSTLATKETVKYSDGRRFFPDNVFPSGLIHSAVTHWANRKDVKNGDSRLEAYKGSYYRVQKVGGTDFGYQITKEYHAHDYEEVLKEYEADNSKKSPKSEFGEGIARYREAVGYGQEGYHADPSGTGYRGENSSVHGVVSGENGRRENSGNTERDRPSSLRHQRQTGQESLEWTPQELYDKIQDLDRRLINATGRYATKLKNQRERYAGMIDEMKGWDSVKLSDRDSESVSNRSLLANALEGAAQNDMRIIIKGRKLKVRFIGLIS